MTTASHLQVHHSHRSRLPLRVLATVLALPLLCTGCLSYALGQGAETAPANQRSFGMSASIVRSQFGVDSLETPQRLILPLFDAEARFHLDKRSDLGVRIVSLSGVMVSYKRQLTRPDTNPNVPENRGRVAMLVGAGPLAYGFRVAGEAALMASSKWSDGAQLYGAVRAMHSVPWLPLDEPNDHAYGVLLGTLFGSRESSIGAETGIYTHQSLFTADRRRVVVVPSLVFRPRVGGRILGIF
jgi:hypothetical protein